MNGKLCYMFMIQVLNGYDNIKVGTQVLIIFVAPVVCILGTQTSGEFGEEMRKFRLFKFLKFIFIELLCRCVFDTAKLVSRKTGAWSWTKIPAGPSVEGSNDPGQISRDTTEEWSSQRKAFQTVETGAFHDIAASHEHEASSAPSTNVTLEHHVARVLCSEPSGINAF